MGGGGAGGAGGKEGYRCIVRVCGRAGGRVQGDAGHDTGWGNLEGEGAQGGVYK